jgi:hypothetical protein
MKKSLTISSLLFTSLIFASDTTFDVGLGINYGGVAGTTANMKISNDIEIFGGLGYAGNTGYVAGGRYYINDSVRFIGNYGTNGIIVKTIITSNTSTSKYETFEGINIGAEYLWGKNNSWSAGLMYIVTSNIEDRTKELQTQGYQVTSGDKVGDIRLSVGCRFY